LYSIEHCPSFL